MNSSIRHIPAPAALPDFRNLGVWLRTLLGVNFLGLLWVLARNRDLIALPGEFVDVTLWLEPPMFVLLPLLHAIQPLLARLSLRKAQGVILGLIVLAACAMHLFFGRYLPQDDSDLLRVILWSLLLGATLLGYFEFRAMRYSPALAEARLLALTARIRPHFLFNSLNAVLGVIRQDPRRAERALEELSDLFRVLMRENRELALLSEEIGIARQYLELERLRLGDRLRVEWQIEACPPDTLMPPLMLQPLLENAVYHGIERSTTDDGITVRLCVNGKQIELDISNPLPEGQAHHGNQMALANIRERLMLFYDLDATLTTNDENHRYTVRIVLPLRRQTQRGSERGGA